LRQPPAAGSLTHVSDPDSTHRAQVTEGPARFNGRWALAPADGVLTDAARLPIRTC